LFDLSRVLASGHWPVAAIRREKGETFGFPGGPSFVWETADADLLGQMMAWSAEAPQAAIEIFNVTNGDVFAWRSVWPALADVLGVQPGADEPASLATYIRENANVWAKIVVKYGLASGDLRTLVGQAINMSISH
jgi:nucleoside-diphosphate-sugar epimerase